MMKEIDIHVQRHSDLEGYVVITEEDWSKVLVELAKRTEVRIK